MWHLRKRARGRRRRGCYDGAAGAAGTGFPSACARLLPSSPAPPVIIIIILKGFATFWEFSFYGQKKVADYENQSLFAEKNHFHT